MIPRACIPFRCLGFFLSPGTELQSLQSQKFKCYPGPVFCWAVSKIFLSPGTELQALQSLKFKCYPGPLFRLAVCEFFRSPGTELQSLQSLQSPKFKCFPMPVFRLAVCDKKLKCYPGPVCFASGCLWNFFKFKYKGVTQGTKLLLFFVFEVIFQKKFKFW